MTNMKVYKSEDGIEIERIRFKGMSHFLSRFLGTKNNPDYLAKRLENSTHSPSRVSWDYFYDSGKHRNLPEYNIRQGIIFAPWEVADLGSQIIEVGRRKVFVAPRNGTFDNSYLASLEWLRNIEIEPNRFYPPRELGKDEIRYSLVKICDNEFYIAPNKLDLEENSNILYVLPIFGGQHSVPSFRKKEEQL